MNARKNTSLSLCLSKEARPWLLLALVLISLVLWAGVFHIAIEHLYYNWQKEEYSHGFLVPFVAALIGFHRLSVKPALVAPSWKGVLLFILALGFALIGGHIASPFPVYFAVWLSLIGLTYAFLGKKAVVTLFPAFIYLIFCFPAPTELYSRLSLELQLLSSYLGAGILSLLSVPVFQDGNILDLGAHKLQVVEACSGLRYLFPLMSFSYLIAYLFKGKLWKRAAIFLSAIPLTILMNALRLATTGLAVNWWGSGMAEGLAHDSQGWVVFLLCVLLLLAGTALLRSPKENEQIDFTPLSPPKGPFTKGELTPSAPALVVMLLLLITLPYALQGGLGGKDVPAPRHGALSFFPKTLKSWQGTSEALDPQTLQVLKLTDYANINFTSDQEKAPVNLYMAYLAMQTMGIILHPPTNCLPGTGWKIEKEDVVPFPLEKTSEQEQDFHLTRLLIRSGQQRMLVYFWYEQQGQPIAGQIEGRLRLMKNSFLHNRTDGALVRVLTGLAPTETEKDGEARLASFLGAAFPAIASSLPQPVKTP